MLKNLNKKILLFVAAILAVLYVCVIASDLFPKKSAQPQYGVGYLSGSTYGTFTGTPITLSTGQNAGLQMDKNGDVYVSATGSLAGTGATTSSLSVLTGVAGVVPYLTYENPPQTLTPSTTSPFVGNQQGALNVDEQLAPQYEDNTNGVAAGANKPLAVSTYSWTLANASPNGTVNIKASTGNIFSLNCVNTSTIPYIVQIFNTATTPSTGNAPSFYFPIAAYGEDVVDGMYFGQSGYNLSSGIALGISVVTSTYSAAPSSIPVACQIMYK